MAAAKTYKESVMARFIRAIHDFSFSDDAKNAWMARPSRAMTERNDAGSSTMFHARHMATMTSTKGAIA
jgi:hypothetical protein